MFVLGCDCMNISVNVPSFGPNNYPWSIRSLNFERFNNVSEKMNGETTWVSNSIALWYIPPVPYCPGFHGWVIGDLSDIGKPPIFEEGWGMPLGFQKVTPEFKGRILSSGKNGRFSCPYEATNDIRIFEDSLERYIDKDISIQCMDEPSPQSPIQGNFKE